MIIIPPRFRDGYLDESLFNSGNTTIYPACWVFRSLAKWVWTSLREAERLRTPVGEESITDMLLLTLAYYCRPEIYVHKFNRNEENTNGADWEWWVKMNGKWLGMRVQAKRIDVARQQYTQLKKMGTGQTGRRKLQVNCLIDNATNSYNCGPKRIPIYCFYNCFDINKTDEECDFCYGCAIASAYSIKTRILSKPVENHYNNVSRYLYPWHYLVCHWKSHDDIKKALDLPRNIYYSILPVAENDLPDYVRQQLASWKKRTNDEQEADERESNLDELAGIVLMDCDKTE